MLRSSRISRALAVFQPGTARAFEVLEGFLPDGAEFTFHLHEGIKTHNVDPTNGRVYTSEDVKLSVEDDVLTVRGEKRQETSQENENFLRSERAESSFHSNTEFGFTAGVTHVYAAPFGLFLYGLLRRGLLRCGSGRSRVE